MEETQNTEFILSLLKIILQLEGKNPKALKRFGDYLGEHPYFTVEKSRRLHLNQGIKVNALYPR